MEGKELPIYVFTYAVEMVQFVFADPILVNFDPLDHSIPARDHARYIANQIADEAKLSGRKFSDSQEEFRKLIKHYELATIEYTSITNDATMPLGFEKHDVYLIN